MKTFVLRLNPDTRKGRPYSAYPSRAEYEAIHQSSPMNGFHEAVNFLPEQGVVRGYLPPKHATALRTREPFALVTITAKTAKVGGDCVVGFQVGCVYEGESPRKSVPKASRELGLIWHFSCPASLSLLLSKPLPNAREVVVGSHSNWLRGPTAANPKQQFLRALDLARRAPTSADDARSFDLLESALRDGLPAPEVGVLENAEFEDAVADAFKHPDESVTGNSAPIQVRVISYQYVRDPQVVAYALRKAKGVCGGCRQSAPFVSRRSGLPYLEVHHKRTLANGGSDTIDNVIALCPNCHRKRHFGQDAV